MSARKRIKCADEIDHPGVQRALELGKLKTLQALNSDPNLGDHLKSVLAAIGYAMGEKSKLEWLGRIKLAERCGKTRNPVGKAIEKLINAGYVVEVDAITNQRKHKRARTLAIPDDLEIPSWLSPPAKMHSGAIIFEGDDKSDKIGTNPGQWQDSPSNTSKNAQSTPSKMHYTQGIIKRSNTGLSAAPPQGGARHDSDSCAYVEHCSEHNPIDNFIPVETSDDIPF